MTISNIRSPQYANADKSAILCTVSLDGEDVPFVASPDDCMEYGRDIYASAIAGEYGTIADYVAPVETETTETASA